MRASDKRLRFVKRWGPIFGVVVLLGLLLMLDGRLKYSPHFGYCPTESSWTVRSPHLVQWWRSFEGTDVAGVVHKDLSEYVPARALSFRQATGIRPTSVRVKAWLGHQILLGGQAGRWGVCVRPGVLLHAGLWLHRSFSGGVAEGGIPEFYLGETGSGGPTSIYYGWRDGFLIMSPWRSYVRGALDTDEGIAESGSMLDSELTLSWLGPPSGTVSLRAEDGLPCRGRVAMALATENSIATIPVGLADASLLFFAGIDGEVLKGLWERYLPRVVGSEVEERAAAMLDFALARWGVGGSTEEWAALFKEGMFALVDVEVSERLPVPEVAFLLPAVKSDSSVEVSVFDVLEHPLWVFLFDGATIPYAWNNTEGAIMPLLGEKLSVCLAREGGYWLAASQEPVMSMVLYHLDSGVAVRGGSSVGVNWAKVATLGDGIGRRWDWSAWGDNEGGGVDGYSWRAFVRTVERLGTLRLRAHVDQGDTLLEGFVARGAGDLF